MFSILLSRVDCMCKTRARIFVNKTRVLCSNLLTLRVLIIRRTVVVARVLLCIYMVAAV